MKWAKRTRQWIRVLRLSHGEGRRVPWLKFARSLLDGFVPQRIYILRLHTCRGCQFFDRKNLRCTACGCYLGFTAFSPQPYRMGGLQGCFGFVSTSGLVGWPAWRFQGRWQKLLSFFGLARDPARRQR